MKHITALFLFINCITITTVLAQQKELTIPVLPDSAIALPPFLQVFTDESNELTWEQVYQRQQSGDFKAFETYEFSNVLERGKYTEWLYLPLNNLTAIEEKFIIRGSGGDSLTFFQIEEGQLISKKKAGALTSTKQTAEIAYSKWDMPFLLPVGNSACLIRYRCFPTHHLDSKNIRLLREPLALKTREKVYMGYYATLGLFVGALFFILLFTLVQYVQNRDKAFLFYALYLTSILVYYWRFYALNNPYFLLLPDWMLATEYFTILYFPMYITYILFLRAFIGKPENFEKLYKVLNFLLIVLFTYLFVERITMYFNLNWAYRLEKIGKPMFLLLGIYLLFSIFKTKKRGPINYILIGTLINVSIVLIGDIITFDGKQSWYLFDISNSISQIGILAELLCFSLGLGAKTKLIEIEKNETKLALQIEQQSSQSLKEIDELKDRFFTNITHEFRTPLTVIQGIAQQIQEKPTKDLNRRTALIQNNAEGLLNMVNQLLDLSKKDFNQYTIKNTQQDVIKYLSYLTDSFYSLAHTKKINLSFHSQINQQLMDFDPKVFQTLVTNLLGNALKFTPEYGKIKILVEALSIDLCQSKISTKIADNHLFFDFKNQAIKSAEYSSYLSLKVTDTGLGIPAKNLPYIFDRFYQADATDERRSDGTGIGLALIKELVELLGGMILVVSQEKIGSTFQLFLPIRNNTALTESPSSTIEITKNGEANSDQVMAQIPTESVLSQPINQVKKEKPLLLIVEDNADVIYYLKACLAETYEILVAMNGVKGLELAYQHIPDLILSDVMMPEIGGYELCHRLKNDARTSHIPIILLTAKVETASKYKGLEAGADAYLTKPFDKKELLLRLENLVLLKKQMQLHLQLNSHLETNQNNATSPVALKELTFLQRLRSTVHTNLNDEFFRAPQLAKAMMMSQTQLYRKIKALTNQSTAQYIRVIRLEKAKDLLKTTGFSIGQIATEVGFKTQAHFTRSFQEEFGKNPSKARK